MAKLPQQLVRGMVSGVGLELLGRARVGARAGWSY